MLVNVSSITSRLGSRVSRRYRINRDLTPVRAAVLISACPETHKQLKTVQITIARESVQLLGVILAALRSRCSASRAGDYSVERAPASDSSRLTDAYRTRSSLPAVVRNICGHVYWIIADRPSIAKFPLCYLIPSLSSSKSLLISRITYGFV